MANESRKPTRRSRVRSMVSRRAADVRPSASRAARSTARPAARMSRSSQGGMSRRQFLRTAGIGAAAAGMAAYGFSGTARAETPPQPGPCNGYTEYDLIAGQHMKVGTVLVGNDENNLYVKYLITEEGWCITETHVHVGLSLADFPLNKGQNPQVGHFDFGNSHDCVTEYEYSIPHSEYISDFEQECDSTQLLVAAHAVVQRENPCPAIMYGSSLGGSGVGGKLYEIDVSTLTATAFFDTGLNPGNDNGPNGNAYDPVNDRLYYSEYRDPEKLWYYDFANNAQIYSGQLQGGAVACGAWYNGKYYYIPQRSGALYEVSFNADGTISAVTLKCNLGKVFVFGDVVVTQNGLMYGSSAVNGVGKFWTVNLNDCTYTEISDLPHMQLAFGSDGTLYGHDAGNSNFYVVDPALGHRTLIGSIGGLKFTDLASGPYDPCGYQIETAWGDGEGFPGKNWAMYFGYTIQCCEPCIQPPEGMVAWWDGDAVSPTQALDISGNGNDGNYSGIITTVPAMVGTGLYFNGQSKVVVPDSPSLRPQQLTVDAWVKLDVDQAYQIELFVSKPFGPSTRNSYALMNYYGHLACYMSFNDGTNTNPIPQDPQTLDRNVWYHVAMTWDGSILRLYKNGVKVSETNWGPKTIAYDPTQPEPLLLGVDDESTNNFRWYLKGTLDEVEIFDRALSAAEILAIYNAGQYGKCKPQQ